MGDRALEGDGRQGAWVRKSIRKASRARPRTLGSTMPPPLVAQTRPSAQVDSKWLTRAGDLHRVDPDRRGGHHQEHPRLQGGRQGLLRHRRGAGAALHTHTHTHARTHAHAHAHAYARTRTRTRTRFVCACRRWPTSASASRTTSLSTRASRRRLGLTLKP